jgi:putative membrane protein
MSGRRVRMPGVPQILLALYLVLFVALALKPFDRAVWYAENLPIVLIVATLVAIYPRFRFSNAAYLLMSVLVYLHTIGGHYTFERVPFGLITDLFGFARNHYDRVAHFSVGFYAFAIAELIDRKQLVRSRWILFLFPVFAIFTVASSYEIIEWCYAASADPTAGAAFLGSQGDIWDAQKDMLADGLGAIVAAAAYLAAHRATSDRPLERTS